VVAVTGSVGKTGTKEMIYNVLNEKFSTFKTEKNHNNDIGLSLTINKNKKRAQNSSSGNGD
jgi:UDP-N-acetylmuramoyl-tripeptide--D-alanyl-D-alanine ligase